MNLLKETKEAIKDSGHKPEDIVFIGSEETGHQCTWDEFKVLANVSYDSGFGDAEVAQDLKIVFADGQTMYRGGYDGSEWWEFSRPFQRPKVKKPVKRVVGAFWPSLKELQDDKDKHHNPGAPSPNTEQSTETPPRGWHTNVG